VNLGPRPFPFWLAAYLAWTWGMRLFELALSARHTRRLRERGAREYGRDHFWIFVVLHALYPVMLVYEVVWLGTHAPPILVWILVEVWLSAQVMRFAAIRTLGEFWNVRIWVLPGMQPIRTGFYEKLRHPNYIAVVLELISGPLMFGAWRTAIAASVLNAIALSIRIPVENRAIAEAAAAEPPTR